MVPTRNEAGNVAPLVARLTKALRLMHAEVLFVDDSTDDTPEVVRQVARDAALPLRLLHRPKRKRTGGSGGAVLAGLRNTGAAWVVVMGADLQHPPETIPKLLARAAADQLDIVVAIRYTRDGSADGFSSRLRELVSLPATKAAKPALPRQQAGGSDPMTGFFAVRRAALNLDQLRPGGFEILLEELARTPGLRVGEVPFVFARRGERGSKASRRDGLRYLAQLVGLRFGSPRELPSLLRFGIVGGTGALVNLGTLALLLRLGGAAHDAERQAVAATLATQVAITWNFLLAETWDFPRDGQWLPQLPLAAAVHHLLPVTYVGATASALAVLFVLRYIVCRCLLYRTSQAGSRASGSDPSDGVIPRHRSRAQPGGINTRSRRDRFRLSAQAGILAVLLLLGGAALVDHRATATAVVTVVTGVLLTIAVISVSWQTYAWRTPDTLSRTGLAHLDQPRLSFSVLVPARHEEAVLGDTIAGLAAVDHPDFEIVVVVGHDDPATHAVANAAANLARVPVKVVVDYHLEKNKPKALNTGLPHCSGDVVMVIDAEDDVQPGLLRLADAAFRHHSADVVQTGIQLMDFDKSWWSARNVLEYFFWFRSRLHFHASQRFITLGGTGVAVRRDLLNHLGGWDETCLAEDCDVGVRASVIGARVVVVYEPRYTTLEETPTDVRAFFRQRVRWMQGFMQVLAKQDWRRLPTRRQRVHAAVVLATPLSQSFVSVTAPLCVAAALALKSPVLIALITFLPLVPTAVSLAFDVLGLHDFGRAFHRKIGWRRYAYLVLSLPVYQSLLAGAAMWAMVRQLRGQTNWHKTRHVNAHRLAGVTAGSPA